ncbi:MAG: hypothetical protein HY040_25645 [Planctomycetes bacterium]|nr:hypothetical protein [Planctomycetota bacterium]
MIQRVVSLFSRESRTATDAATRAQVADFTREVALRLLLAEKPAFVGQAIYDVVYPAIAQLVERDNYEQGLELLDASKKECERWTNSDPWQVHWLKVTFYLMEYVIYDLSGARFEASSSLKAAILKVFDSEVPEHEKLTMLKATQEVVVAAGSTHVKFAIAVAAATSRAKDLTKAVELMSLIYPR